MLAANPRVLHIAPAIFGAGDEFFGGAERYVYELAQAMSRVVPTTLLTFGPKSLTRQDETLRVEVFRNWIHYRRLRFDPFNPAILWRLRHADIVHYHQTYTMMAGLTALAGRVLRKPVFTTDAGAGGYGLHRLCDTRNLYAGHLHISDFSRRHFGHGNLPSATVIHGGVNSARFSPDLHVRRTNEVLFVGRLLPHKGINYLIDAVQTDIPLRIIGRPFRHAAAYRELLLRMAGGKPVTFATHCSDADLLSAYRTALCIVLPSVYESVDGRRHVIPELLGLTVLEAMACGTPAICTNVTSLPEIVEDGVSGFVVPPNDPAALRDRMLWLRDNPAAAAQMGDAARRRAVDRFGWGSAVRECLAAYARASNSIDVARSDG
jgi:glycosyltransferase involved in cell wall biosynthesis